MSSTSIAYLEPVVRPAAELHLAVLVVEGEPGDVDLARGHEDARRDVGALPLRRHHHVRRICPVKCLTRTGVKGDIKHLVFCKKCKYDLARGEIGATKCFINL